tara:strand:+ start:3230 stop:3739 length:510 start_codon:yes stop_codon:yes gene_type:complete
MKIQDINNLSSEQFINNFNNIFEKTSSIAISSEKKRPFNDKNEMIETFINEFDNLNIDSKKNVLINHPDLGNKLKITNDLTEMSKDEQRNVGLDNCTEDEFLFFKKMNDEYKLKFSIPFIFAVKGSNKSIIIDEFKRRLINEDIELEIEEAINQVKKIAKFRLDEIIND